jgi:hypothetical protein
MVLPAARYHSVGYLTYLIHDIVQATADPVELLVGLGINGTNGVRKTIMRGKTVRYVIGRHYTSSVVRVWLWNATFIGFSLSAFHGTRVALM